MKKGLLLLLPALVFVLSGSAWATILTCGGTADCEGWSLSGFIRLGEESWFDAHWEIELLENGVTQVYYNTGTEPISGYQYDEFNISASGDYGGIELCGDYVVKGRIWFTWGPLHECTFEIPFTCDCPNGGGGCGTPGFWKNREEEWPGYPATSIDIGCRIFDRADIVKIFEYRTRGDVRVILAQHMVAAEFNTLTGGGTGPEIMQAISDAKAYLCEFGFTIGPRRPGGTVPKEDSDKDRGEAIKNELERYNEDYSNCPDRSVYTTSFDRAAFGYDGSEESKSWGAIKEIYK